MWPKYFVKTVDRKYGLHWLGPMTDSGCNRVLGCIIGDVGVGCIITTSPIPKAGVGVIPYILINFIKF